MIDKIKFIEYMIENGYIEGNRKEVSYGVIGTSLGIDTYHIDELKQHNPDYIKDGYSTQFRSIKLTNKHREDFPEYYL